MSRFVEDYPSTYDILESPKEVNEMEAATLFTPNEHLIWTIARC